MRISYPSANEWIDLEKDEKSNPVNEIIPFQSRPLLDIHVSSTDGSLLMTSSLSEKSFTTVQAFSTRWTSNQNSFFTAPINIKPFLFVLEWQQFRCRSTAPAVFIRMRVLNEMPHASTRPSARTSLQVCRGCSDTMIGDWHRITPDRPSNISSLFGSGHEANVDITPAHSQGQVKYKLDITFIRQKTKDISANDNAVKKFPELILTLSR